MDRLAVGGSQRAVQASVEAPAEGQDLWLLAPWVLAVVVVEGQFEGGFDRTGAASTGHLHTGKALGGHGDQGFSNQPRPVDVWVG